MSTSSEPPAGVISQTTAEGGKTLRATPDSPTATILSPTSGIQADTDSFGAEPSRLDEESNSFETDEDALTYLRRHVPANQEPKIVNLAALQERLLDIPSQPSAGHHEFVGKNGLTVSYDLVKSDSFSDCYLNLKDDANIQGDWKPIFRINDLTVRTPNFTYSLKYPASLEHARINGIFWLPGLGSGESELSHDYVNLGSSAMYLLGSDGFFSTPIDLLGLFHEIGHIETYPTLPQGADTTTHTMGYRKQRTVKMTAYELQREESANAWMRTYAHKLFEDLDITPELVEEFCQMQLESYHEVARRRFLNTSQDTSQAR